MSGMTSTLSDPRPIVVSASVSAYSAPFGRPLFLSYTSVASPGPGGTGGGEPGSVFSTASVFFRGGLAAGIGAILLGSRRRLRGDDVFLRFLPAAGRVLAGEVQEHLA